MSGFKEYEEYDGLGLAELVKKGEVSPEELCEEAISRIEERNPAINAVVYKMYDIARKSIKKGLPDGPFKGVPFLLKDLDDPYAGVPLTYGSKAFKNYIPDFDSELITRFKRAGVNAIGKTNTPEFGLKGVTEPELFGPARNPWNTNHTPGGSSGGSASAVAAGIVPLASGGDGGGSIRIPASCCGLFGLKPSRGRIPTGPGLGERWQGAVVHHVITRSVRDSAAMLDFVQGMDPGARCIAPVPNTAYLDESQKDPRKLKIAFDTKSPIGMRVEQSCIEAVQKAVELLRDLGHEVEEARPAIDGMALAHSYFTMYYGEVAATLSLAENLLGRKPSSSEFELDTQTIANLGGLYTAGDFVIALKEWDIAARKMADFHQKYDLYLTPTLAFAPVEVGSLEVSAMEKILVKVINALNLTWVVKKAGIIEKIAFDNLEKSPFTQLANLTGQPSMSVPLHWSEAGLPIGVQFTAPYADETTLFQLAGQLERATNWGTRRPAMST